MARLEKEDFNQIIHHLEDVIKVVIKPAMVEEARRTAERTANQVIYSEMKDELAGAIRRVVRDTMQASVVVEIKEKA